MRVPVRVVGAAALVLAFAGPAEAMEWRLGVSYASGVSDVADLYEELYLRIIRERHDAAPGPSRKEPSR